MSVVRY